MAKAHATEAAFDVVVRALTPALGANMARSIARGQWDKLGLAGNKLDAAQLARLGDALRPGLVVFIGKTYTDALLDQIRHDLAGGADG
jgi:hypothetical protein